jgi:hypothetical protein
MKAEAPFVLSRFEYEQRHLYFLPTPVFDQLEGPKPVHLVGTRGTGKTTLLQAMHWRERLQNEMLSHQLGGAPFGKHYIALYMKLPDTQLQVVDEWLRGASLPQRGILLAMYLDLLWLELLLEALAELVVADVLHASAAMEQHCVSEVATLFGRYYPEQRSFVREKQPRTFIDLAEMFRSARRTIERSAVSGVDTVAVLNELPVDQVGAFGRKMAVPFVDFCNAAGNASDDPWHFKVCMDEAEVLNEYQLRLINTMTRLGAAPVFFVLSFVAQTHVLTGTLLPDLTLSEADRRLVVLDEMTEASFRQLAEGVSNVRIRATLGRPHVNFDIYRSLGRLSINGLLAGILSASVDPKARKLLADANEFQAAALFKDAPPDESREPASQEPPPIYQTYLVQTLGLRPPGAGANWRRRHEDSAKFRKRMVASYLSICRALGADVRYASADMVLHMSDRCIRDYLAFMHDIFAEMKSPLEEALGARVPNEAQNKAIKRASRHKRATIAERGVPAPTETGRLIDALAQITQIIQTESSSGQHLTASERGVFVLTLRGGDDGRWGRLLELIADANETGFLRLLEGSGATWRFRVHKSLAAAYGFSYRGAYYACRIAPEELAPLLAIVERKQFEGAVRALGLRLAGAEVTEVVDDDKDTSQAPLFEGLT